MSKFGADTDNKFRAADLPEICRTFAEVWQEI